MVPVELATHVVCCIEFCVYGLPCFLFVLNIIVLLLRLPSDNVKHNPQPYHS